ncbi:MAG: hypothetical protein KAW09_03465, partial [Thermoplasmata archaeon]|nr:hypothetical protein [Thermoplasmata archaeon]
MGEATRRQMIVAFVGCVLVICGISVQLADEGLAQGDSILDIGCQDEPLTRNILAANDVWTHNVLDPVYDSV